MLQIIVYVKQSLKKSFDNLHNEKLKHNLLQAIPFWIASLITGVFAVLYAKIFTWGEELMNYIFDWNPLMIFIPVDCVQEPRLLAIAIVLCPW